MRRVLISILMLVTAGVAAGAAQAVVIDQGTAGKFGVALTPSTRGDLAAAGLSPTTWNTACADPWLASDLGGPIIPPGGLCWHGGPVIHKNETFDLAWDPNRRDWATTRDYVEQFLRNVANGSGTLTSPYALTPQYNDQNGRASNTSLYGGGCIDYGGRGGSACQFGSTDGSGSGNDYPATACPPGVSGTNYFAEDVTGGIAPVPDDVCLTDAQIRTELGMMISQENLVGHLQPGYSPLLVLMTPPGVVDCLGTATPTVCSANGTLAPPQASVSTTASGGAITPGTYRVEVTYILASGETVPGAPQSITTTGNFSTITVASPPPLTGATGWYAYMTGAGGTTYTRQQPAAPTAIGTNLPLSAAPTSTGPEPPTDATPSFCSYHSELSVGGTAFPYVVLPWTALTDCDEPDAPQIPDPVSATDLANDVGARLVNSLAESTLAAIVNPALDGWSALSGNEIDDNGCTPLDHNLDQATVGNTPYFLQREFNNGGMLESDPNAPACAGLVNLAPTFVAPSAADRGDVVEFDGSKTNSTLVVPRAGYVWDFGDGSTAIGPSVEHSYAYGGTYAVKLTVTDRGGYTASLTQKITVLGPTQPGTTPGGGKKHHHKASGLQAHIQLMPQGLQDVLRHGVATRVTSNRRATGIVTLLVPRAVARRARIHAGRGAAVVVGRGTVSQITAGTVSLHLHLSHTVAGKLRHLRHVALTVRLALIASGGDHLTIDAAGRY